MNDIDMAMNEVYQKLANMLIKRTRIGWMDEETCRNALDKLSECKESTGGQIDIKFTQLREILNMGVVKDVHDSNSSN
ncbi:hypothetical protein [Desulfitibacter alkalitolerans]|uniref:hypothetical protein n=1 Tax=Desulfitibacter alkalitolerans TaxID=264641 RepID=UPI00048966C6|nr:hypothetical protein [Desulfitibacter alkalitolerans]